MNVWSPVVDHVGEQLDFGRLCTVEVDSWFLPDTRGVSYRIAPREEHHRPPDARPAGAADWATSTTPATSSSRATTSTGSSAWAATPRIPDLPPYMEVVRLDRVRHNDPGLVAKAVALTADHLARRPDDNPVARLGARIERDLRLAGRAGHRDLPPVLVRHVPSVRRQRRAGRLVRRLAEPQRPVRAPSPPPVPSVSWRPGPRPCSSLWPGWCGAARSISRRSWYPWSSTGHPPWRFWTPDTGPDRPDGGIVERRNCLQTPGKRADGEVWDRSASVERAPTYVGALLARARRSPRRSISHGVRGTGSISSPRISLNALVPGRAGAVCFLVERGFDV